MVRVIISSNDPVVYILRDESESNDLFGEDYIKDYGIDIPIKLLSDYKKAYAEFWRIQEELKKFDK